MTPELAHLLFNWSIALLFGIVGASGFFYWGMILERGRHECPPCHRKHPDDR